MKLLTVSGSVQNNSSNIRLLESMAVQFPEHNFQRFDLERIPIFHPDRTGNPVPEAVANWRQKIQESDAVIISTPVYIFNIPAVLKNALEWLASSGELNEKRTIALTYTPAEPRGEKAMQSLLWCLQALGAQVKVSVPLYQSTLKVNADGSWEGEEAREMIQEALNLL